MIRRPPRSTLFPYRRSSDLVQVREQPLDQRRLAHEDVDEVDPAGPGGRLPGVDLHERSNRARTVRQEDVLVRRRDRKSTRLNSSHSQISYAVFCLKKKKQST